MLFIHNDVVAEILNMEDCIAAQEQAFRDLAEGRAAHRPRSDIYAPCEREDGYYRWGTMEGYSGGYLAIRMKSDVMTWPLAFINDGHIQHMRVGGGGGIGAKYLARKDARTVGMLGSGGMARTYLQAYCAVRGITKVKVYSPTRANREAYASEMSRRLNIEIQAVDSAEEAVRGSDIVSSCSDSMTPTFEADWLEPGQHVTMLGPMEISNAVLERCDVKISQGSGGLDVEARNTEKGVGHSPMAWIAGSADERKRLPPKQEDFNFIVDFPDFADLIADPSIGRTDDEQITFYHNVGNQGLQFSSVGGLVYEKAREAGVGRQVPTDWFLQDIRD